MGGKRAVRLTSPPGVKGKDKGHRRKNLRRFKFEMSVKKIKQYWEKTQAVTIDQRGAISSFTCLTGKGGGPNFPSSSKRTGGGVNI